MEFILSKIISRAPRTEHSDCTFAIDDKSDCIDVPSNTAAENTIYDDHIDNGFDDNIDTVNSLPKQIWLCVCFYFYSFNN